MDAFEKWSKDYFNEHGFAPTPKESYRAGMLRAAELATNMDSVEEYCADILAEADK